MARNRFITVLALSLLLVPAFHASELSDKVARAAEHFQMAEIERAQALLHEVLSQGLSSADALEARNQAGTRVLLRMLQNDLLNPPVKKILDLAAEAERAQLTSPDLIQSLVRDLESDFTSRQLALEKLAAAGDVAVPFLLDLLADPVSEERRTYAQMAIARLGAKALWPLCAALATEDAMLRTNLCVALGNIGDPRALPYLKQIADDPEQLQDARERAAESVSRIAGRGATSLPDAATLFSDSSEKALQGLPRTGDAFDAAPARIWWWETGKLRSQDLPASLVDAELARAHALRAVAIDPESARAARLFASSTLAFSLLLDRAPVVPDALRDELSRYVSSLSAFGPETMAQALLWFMAQGRDDAALLSVGQLTAQFDALSQSSILPPQAVSDHVRPILADAMEYPDALVRASAMELFSKISADRALPEKAPQVMSMAVAATHASSQPAVLVAAESGETRNRFASSLREGGFDVVEAKSPSEAISAASKRLRFHALVAEESFSRSRTQLLQLPSLKRAAVFVVARSPDVKAASAAWPGTSLLFAGSEAPDYIIAAVRKAAASSLTDEQARKTNLSGSNVLRNHGPAAGSILLSHIQDLESLVRRQGPALGAAVAALVATRSPDALPALESAVSAPTEPRIRAAALLGMSVILRHSGRNPDNYLPSLVVACGDDDEFLAHAARVAIGLLNLRPGRAAALYQRITLNPAPPQPPK